MKQYLELVNEILEFGRYKMDRTGTGCYSLFGRQLRYDLSGGRLPVITTKAIPIKKIIAENLWFLSGDTNNNTLLSQDIKFWSKWALQKDIITDSIELGGDNTVVTAAPEGDLGPIYGAMWRHWPDTRFCFAGGTEQTWLESQGYVKTGEIDQTPEVPVPQSIMYREIDQISELIRNLKERPFSRRHVISGWNPAVLPVEGDTHENNVAHGLQALPPCHALFQFYVEQLTPYEMLKELGRRIGERVATEAYRSFLATDDREEQVAAWFQEQGVPNKRLSCQLYQR